jgi:hypothetical protein
MLRSLFFSFILFITSFACFSQQYLLFQKNRYRQAIYKVGDVISFRMKNDRSKFTGQIYGFEDSVMIFHYYRINPKEISHLYVDNKTRIWFILRYKYGKVLPIAGAGYVLLDAINTGQVRGESLAIGGTLVATGLLLKAIIGDKIRIRGKRKLVILGGENSIR